MAASSSSKSVLVCLGESRRPVSFRRGDTAATERKALVLSVASAFEDVFDAEPPSPSNLLLQLKSEEWGGEFVDLKSDEPIPDRSVLRIVLGKCKVSLDPMVVRSESLSINSARISIRLILQIVWTVLGVTSYKLVIYFLAS